MHAALLHAIGLEDMPKLTIEAGTIPAEWRAAVVAGITQAVDARPEYESWQAEAYEPAARSVYGFHLRLNGARVGPSLEVPRQVCERPPRLLGETESEGRQRAFRDAMTRWLQENVGLR
jgi:hypothetical protein